MHSQIYRTQTGTKGINHKGDAWMEMLLKTEYDSVHIEIFRGYWVLTFDMVPTQILLNNFKNLYAQKDRDNAGGAAHVQSCRWKDYIVRFSLWFQLLVRWSKIKSMMCRWIEHSPSRARQQGRNISLKINNQLIMHYDSYSNKTTDYMWFSYYWCDEFPRIMYVIRSVGRARI